MTPTEVAAKLRQFNAWRRDFEDKVEQPDSSEVGEAIDAAVEMIDRLEAAEKERNDVAQQLVQSEQGKRKISEECDALRAMLRAALDVLEEVRGNINPERGYADELEADVERAIATIALPGAKGE